jgi:hypothetical protein
MPLTEKHGGLWLDDPADVRTQPVYERFESTLLLLAIVVRSPSGHFIASVFEKGAPDGQWRLPFWSERRPDALFADRQSAILHVESLLQTTSGA